MESRSCSLKERLSLSRRGCLAERRSASRLILASLASGARPPGRRRLPEGGRALVGAAESRRRRRPLGALPWPALSLSLCLGGPAPSLLWERGPRGCTTEAPGGSSPACLPPPLPAPALLRPPPAVGVSGTLRTPPSHFPSCCWGCSSGHFATAALSAPRGRMAAVQTYG